MMVPCGYIWIAAISPTHEVYSIIVFFSRGNYHHKKYCPILIQIHGSRMYPLVSKPAENYPLKYIWSIEMCLNSNVPNSI